MSALNDTDRWEPIEHPRGNDGRFIRKGTVQTLLSHSKLNTMHVIQAIQDLDEDQWNNLTQKQRHYIVNAVEKLPIASNTYKNAKTKIDRISGTIIPTALNVSHTQLIPAHKGAIPGSPAKITTTLVWGKYSDGDVILEKSDGKSRVMWNALVKKYVKQQQSSLGVWSTTAVYGKKSLYDQMKSDTDWVVPGTQSKTSQVPKTLETPNIIETSNIPKTLDVSNVHSAIEIHDIVKTHNATETSTSQSLRNKDGSINWSAVQHAAMADSTAPGTSVVQTDDNRYFITRNDSGDFTLHFSYDGSDDGEIEDVYVSTSISALIDDVGPNVNWEISPNLKFIPSTSVSAFNPSAPLGFSGDISAIDIDTTKQMKDTLKVDNVGYWSKPEKIWDSIRKVQQQHHDLSALQVLNTLDSTLRTNVPSPFAAKMIKWAATPNGQAHIKKSLLSTETSSITNMPKPLSESIQSGISDISYLTHQQKLGIYASFKKQSNSYLSSDDSDIFHALNVAAVDNNISVAQAIKVIDEVSAQNVSKVNVHLFENKIKSWLTTKQGTIAASSAVTVDDKILSKILARKIKITFDASTSEVMDFKKSSVLTYSDMQLSDIDKFATTVLQEDKLTPEQIRSLGLYSSGGYININAYLYGKSDLITPKSLASAKQIQSAMRLSDRPMLLHRATNFVGIADSTSFEDLKTKVGQTWVSGGFFSTSAGNEAAFMNSKSLAVEIEAPPGTPMVWMEHLVNTPYGKQTITNCIGENEMLLAAGLSYKIMSVQKNSSGKPVVRVRIVPSSKEVVT